LLNQYIIANKLSICIWRVAGIKPQSKLNLMTGALNPLSYLFKNFLPACIYSLFSWKNNIIKTSTPLKKLV
jgi:hypothetical protein